MPGVGSLFNESDFTRRQKDLARRIISAAHSACDAGDLDSALQLLRAVDLLIRPKGAAGRDKRQIVQHAIMAHERLWLLRFPEAASVSGAGLMVHFSQ